MLSRIHQEQVIGAAPSRVYDVLTSSAEFAAMTGVPAEIDPEAGGPFSCFGGAIEGRNIECVPGERLVQAWRAAAWDPGLYSIVRFEFRPEQDQTRVVLDHAGFPEAEGEHLDEGWQPNYWQPLRKLLG
jgi:activator of HSP90 ATPase